EVAEDDGEKVVEVVRDSPGELANRLHLERLPERLLGRKASVHLMIQALRPAQDREQGEKQEQGCRSAEQQVRRHAADPFVANRGSCNSGAEIKRGVVKAPGRKAPPNAVDRRGCSV